MVYVLLNVLYWQGKHSTWFFSFLLLQIQLSQGIGCSIILTPSYHISSHSLLLLLLLLLLLILLLLQWISGNFSFFTCKNFPFIPTLICPWLQKEKKNNKIFLIFQIQSMFILIHVLKLSKINFKVKRLEFSNFFFFVKSIFSVWTPLHIQNHDFEFRMWNECTIPNSPVWFVRTISLVHTNLLRSHHELLILPTAS